MLLFMVIQRNVPQALSYGYCYCEAAQFVCPKKRESVETRCAETATLSDPFFVTHKLLCLKPKSQQQLQHLTLCLCAKGFLMSRDGRNASL